MDNELLHIDGGFSAFKDSTGRFRTQSLFGEYKHPNYPAFFTLKKYDHKGRISLYRKYMEIADPTEYQVAQRLFGSWEHWLQLTRAQWFREHLNEWRDELAVRMASERYQEMQDRVLKDPNSPTGIQASKWLSDMYGKKPSKRGRPTKAEIEARLKRDTSKISEIEEDAQRIGLEI